MELLEQRGPLVKSEIARLTGWNSKTLAGYLATLERTGRATWRYADPNGPGRPPKLWSAVVTAAEPAERASGARSAPAELPAALAPEPEPEEDDDDGAAAEEAEGVVEIGEYREPRGRRTTARINAENRPFADRIVAACRQEPMSVPRIAEVTGIERRKVQNIVKNLVATRELEARGSETVGNYLGSKYRVPPTLKELGVETRMADRSGPLEERVLASLSDKGPATIELLAARLVVHVRAIAPVLEHLIADGRVEKLPALRYSAKESLAA